MQLAPKEWEIFRSRYIPSVLPILFYWSWPVSEYLGVSKGTIVNIWREGHYTAVWERAAAQRIAERVISMLRQESCDLDVLRSHGLASGEATVSLCTAFARSTDGDLAAAQRFLLELKIAYQQFIKDNMVFWLFSGEVLDRAISQELAASGLEAPDIEEIRDVMTRPTIESYSAREEREFASLVSRARREGLEEANLMRDIAAFARSYEWFPFEYVGPDVWTAQTVVERIRSELLKPEGSAHDEDVHRVQRACMDRYKLSGSVLRLFEIQRYLTLLQDDRKMINARLCLILNGTILPHLGAQCGASPGLSLYIDPTFLSAGPGEDARSELMARSQSLVVVQEGTDEAFFVGSESMGVLTRLGIVLPGPVDEASEITGRIAFKGFVRGSVRVVRTSSGCTPLMADEILVTGMTTPDFVPLLRDAAAIITDEGGITCHAAIVSRELKKPCIIGTKIATQVLKDGDMVEVDAEKGVVRKIG